MTERVAPTLVVAACLLGMGVSVALIRAAYVAIDRRLFGGALVRRERVRSDRSSAPVGPARKGGEDATATAPRETASRVDALASQASRLAALLEAAEHAEAEAMEAEHAALAAALRGDAHASLRAMRRGAQAAHRGTAALTEVHAMVMGGE